MQLGHAQTGTFDGFGFRDRAAVDRAEKIVEQALTGCSVVENVTDERRFRSFFDEVFQTFGSCVEAFEKERVDGCVASRELRRVQVPTLIESISQRMLNVLVMEFPRAMHDVAVLVDLLFGQRATFRRAMRRSEEHTSELQS